PLAWMVASTWQGVTKLRLKAGLKQQELALKQQMIERGMTADEIVQVLGPASETPADLSAEEDDEAGGVNEPCARAVGAERHGAWSPALVLRRGGDRCLIHTCPGYGGVVQRSGNEWVKANRVLFPASSSGEDGSPRGSADRTETFGASQWSGQPKKEPVP